MFYGVISNGQKLCISQKSIIRSLGHGNARSTQVYLPSFKNSIFLPCTVYYILEMSKLIHKYPNHFITMDTNWTITNYQTINYNVFQYPTHRHKNVKGAHFTWVWNLTITFYNHNIKIFQILTLIKYFTGNT